jgi:hypothetical protein
MTAASDSPGVADIVPIDTYLRELAVARDLPDLAINMCVSRYAESGPALRAILDRAADGEVLTEEDENLLFRGLYILGAKREQGAFRPLLRLLRLGDTEIHRLLGDAVTEDLPRIAISLFDGDADALFDAIADQRRDEFVRYSLFKTAAFLAFEGRIERERIVRFLERFWEERLAEDGAYVWIGWIEAIGTLGLRFLAPLVEKAWSSGRIPANIMEPRHFEEDLAEAEAAPQDIKRFTKFHPAYIDDAVAALEWTRPKPEPKRKAKDQWAGKPITSPSETRHNPMRHVGRNDPCPCGSGKKAKRCCLATQ